ncbi:MAG: hypothetical protein U0821_14725 [Chloroflexota bacterium]
MFYVRLVAGALLMYLGIAHLLDQVSVRDALVRHAVWQAWPLVGGYSALELTLRLAALEFFLGVFVFGGLLTRFLAPISALVTAAQVVALQADAYLGAWLATVAAAAVSVWGGGRGTMDSSLGRMQRRSIEREAERTRLRAEAREARQRASDEATGEA